MELDTLRTMSRRTCNRGAKLSVSEPVIRMDTEDVEDIFKDCDIPPSDLSSSHGPSWELADEILNTPPPPEHVMLAANMTFPQFATPARETAWRLPPPAPFRSRVAPRIERNHSDPVPARRELFAREPPLREDVPAPTMFEALLSVVEELVTTSPATERRDVKVEELKQRFENYVQQRAWCKYCKRRDCHIH